MIYFIKSFKDFKEYTTLLGEGGGGGNCIWYEDLKKLNLCKYMELLPCWILLIWHNSGKYDDSYEQLHVEIELVSCTNFVKVE